MSSGGQVLVFWITCVPKTGAGATLIIGCSPLHVDRHALLGRRERSSGPPSRIEDCVLREVIEYKYSPVGVSEACGVAFYLDIRSL